VCVCTGGSQCHEEKSSRWLPALFHPQGLPGSGPPHLPPSRAPAHTTTHPPCPTGQKLSAPILFAPMAQQRLCHPLGELAMARAAAAAGLPYILSTMATSSIQEVAEAVQQPDHSSSSSSTSSSSQGAAPSRLPPASAAAGTDPCLWFQVYVMKRRDVTEWMVREVHRLGFKALVVTVDAPRLGGMEDICCLPALYGARLAHV
jgi:hypothetical protein